ncbi:hypothetical protein GCM10023200_32400 [Actinomycetospora chlora]|uniref:Uncharacterized protein n=1 Tax=Actinomycetospora chlora TaxID=663608 RepID=A0ABP9BE72_9PSEU
MLDRLAAPACLVARRVVQHLVALADAIAFTVALAQFAPLAPRMARGWLPVLLDRLLAADTATLRLLGHDPFGGARPAWVRATGAWWHRELIGDYLPARTLPRESSAP